MKYTSEEALAEIMQRKDRIVQRRIRRACQALAGVSCLLTVLLLAVISVLPGRSGQASAETVYGSFLLSAEAGGYVLAAVIAFALGVLVTLLCLKHRKKMSDTET